MDRISCEECIIIYKIEKKFIDHLADNGIISLIEENSRFYLLHESLPIVEKYARMHYDLNVNLEGIEVIHHLLQRIMIMESKLNNTVIG